MYKVTCLYQGTTYVLHDPESDILRLFDDEIETEDNEPGSFQFSVSCDHPYLDKIVGLASDIRVYDGSEEIFRGRPIDDGEDLYRTRTFKCEGELAFLFDSIQPRREIHEVTPFQFFKLLVDEHNAQVRNRGPIDKTFQVGVCTVIDSNDSLYRYTNRETTLDDIREKIIDRLGGHLCVRVLGNTRYLDLLKDVSTVADQPIQLGENLLDYAKDTDYTQVATACIPLGERMEETEIGALDAYLTIETVNNGSDCIMLNEAVENFGFICKVVNFEDITLPANLKTAGENWLQSGQYADITFTLTAVDLHALGYDVQPLRKNTQVRLTSEPHGMNRWFEISKRTYHLTEPDTDTVVFGTTDKKKSYTSSTGKAVSSVQSKIAEQAVQTESKINSVVASERLNISNLIALATHGYVVMDPADGPERILIMDTNSIETASKIWKWDMNGLAYGTNSTPGVPLDQWTWKTAITMNGEISADFIVTGHLLASLITSGKIQSENGRVYFDLTNNEMVCSRMRSSNPLEDGWYYEGVRDVILDVVQSNSNDNSWVHIYKDEHAEEGLYIRPPVRSGECVVFSGASRLTIQDSLDYAKLMLDKSGDIRLSAKESITLMLQSGGGYIEIVKDASGRGQPVLWGDVKMQKIVGNSYNGLQIDGDVWINGNVYCKNYKVNPN